ncbi:sec-independent protein translocase protein TatA [Melghiribacillus thermohalophilus]|uniref:Sec-independent protein translocase protein TatA n=1 Tax=Melghiribacillus thermohalophilus TaxID=1324956 RepID=A0A4R3NA38_9BACI|nr:twin-arginine translocase TatA/TatE family subunit [Melghiribacillus thermohalophilus]TCT25510.1 sec-independent protein translocase protein TatA [Melghiribacillus thermohalophilus]
MAQIGVPGLILILIIALVIFGPSKLPEIGKAFGSSLREFKHAATDTASNQKDEQKILDAKEKNVN